MCDQAPAYAQEKLLLAAFTGGPALEEEVKHRRRCEEIIDFLEIQPMRNTRVTTPYGLQKRVELARALAMEPNYCYLMNLWPA